MKRFLAILAFIALASVVVSSQAIPPQVLQLLTRANTWSALQTYANAIKVNVFIPADTTRTLYTDGTNLFFGLNALTGGGSVLTPHNLLSTAHPDTLVATVSRGSVLVGNSTPLWAEVTIGAAGSFLRSDGTDASWGTNGSALTNLTAGNLTGALPAISGALLTTLNASNLASGTVPLARLAGITNTEISAAAAIAYTKLDLAGSINLSTDTAATALPFAKGGTGLTAAALNTTPISTGIAWVATAVPDCDAATSALNYDTTTSAYSCRTLALGSGTVTSVALSLPAFLTVTGSPVTTTGTLTGTLATQTANTIFSGPNTGAPASPTFRAMVNADLPLTGVVAGTYASVTVNTRGVVTGATATQDAATTLTGLVGVANGGSGQASIGDDNVFVGSAATTVAATALPNCTSANCWGIGYTTATNLFAAITARTVIAPIWLDAGYCQNATAVMAWSTPVADPAVAACVTGSNTQKLVLDFADGANTLSVQKELKLPSDFTSTVDVNIWWYTTATAGDVVWQVATICVGNTETGDPAFNTASTVTDTAQGTTNQYNLATITGLTTTGCAAGEVLYVRVFRDPTNGGDTLAATARLVGIELVLRRSI